MVISLETFGLDKLTREDKLLVARLLWNSADATEVRPSDLAHLTEEQIEELKRRNDDDENNPNELVDWEDVQTQIDRIVAS